MTHSFNNAYTRIVTDLQTFANGLGRNHLCQLNGFLGHGQIHSSGTFSQAGRSGVASRRGASGGASGAAGFNRAERRAFYA